MSILRRCVPIAVALLMAAAVFASPAAARSGAASCTFRGPEYPALGRAGKPGNLYLVFIRRRVTCDEARTIALRATQKRNPGPFATFAMPGGWQVCLSFAPSRVSRVIAGQCVKPGSGALVNWAPACDTTQAACKNLRKPR